MTIAQIEQKKKGVRDFMRLVVAHNRALFLLVTIDRCANTTENNQYFNIDKKLEGNPPEVAAFLGEILNFFENFEFFTFFALCPNLI